VPRNILNISLFETLGSRTLRILAIDKSNLSDLLIRFMNNAAVSVRAIIAARLNV